MLKWLVELGEFDIQYILRTTIKAEMLVDFISNMTPSLEGEGGEPITSIWTLFIDSLTTLERGRAGLVLRGLKDQTYKHTLRFEFKITNNKVEYEALLSRLWLLHELNMQELEVYNDSQLVIS